MYIKAQQKFIRQPARKLRLIANSIRRYSLQQAFNQLQALNKGAALPLRKTLRQAQANAVNNLKLDPSKLKIKEIQINDGPVYKRMNPVSRGRGHAILKRTSHIRILLEAPDAPVSNPAPEAKGKSRATINNSKPPEKKVTKKVVRKKVSQ